MLIYSGISSPYMSTLSVFGKTLCQILDEYSAMKQTEACYLRNKNEEANSTAKLSEMWKKVEEAMSALRLVVFKGALVLRRRFPFETSCSWFYFCWKNRLLGDFLEWSETLRNF